MKLARWRVVSSPASCRPGARPAARRAQVDVWGRRHPPPRAALLAGAAEAEGLLSLLTDPVDAELIEAAPRLRVISNYAVGVDNVDVEAATARGIPVGHTPEVLTDSTADLAVALMLAIARRLPRASGSSAPASGGPGTRVFLGRDLHGATVAIVGGGRIGRAVARRLEGFGCEVSSSAASGGARALGGGLRQRPHAADRANPGPDRRGRAAGDEADRLPGQHRPRADRRHRRARARPCARAGSPARRSTSPIPSRCRPITRCSARRTCS